MSITLSGDGWVSNVAGVGTGGSTTNTAFYLTDQTVTADFTVPTGKNAMTAGDIVIADNVTVTVSTGSNWTVV